MLLSGHKFEYILFLQFSQLHKIKKKKHKAVYASGRSILAMTSLKLQKKEKNQSFPAATLYIALLAGDQIPSNVSTTITSVDTQFDALYLIHDVKITVAKNTSLNK